VNGSTGSSSSYDRSTTPAFDNTCVIILGAQIKEIDVDVLEARKLITSNKGNLNRLLLDGMNSARAHLERAFDTLTQCGTLLGTGRVVGDGSIFAEVNGVVGDIGALNNLDPRKETKIAALIEHTILANLTAIREQLFGEGAGAPLPAMRFPIAQPMNGDSSFLEFNSRLFSLYFRCLAELIFAGEPGTACSDFESFLDAISNSEKLDVVEASAISGMKLPTGFVPQLSEKGAIPFEFLRLFKVALGIAHQRLVQAQRVLREITMFKKCVYKGLREVYNLLRASNFGGRGASELPNDITQVYTLNGVLIAMQANGLSTAALTNGLYLAVTESRDAMGKAIVQVRKIVVAR